jgi:hypothetical protein
MTHRLSNPRMRIATAGGFLLASTWLSALLPGCLMRSHECELGFASCDDGIATVCVQQCGDTDSDEACATLLIHSECRGDEACVQPDASTAFCALSAHPEPKCKGASTYCDGDLALNCRSGYATLKDDCTPTAGTCAELPSFGATCVLLATPHPSCDEALTESTGCNGFKRLQCLDGYLIEAEPCDATCVQPWKGYGFCAESSEPDPRCAGISLSEVEASVCDGDSVVTCELGYAIATYACQESGAACGERDGEARCVRADHAAD